MRLPKRLIPLSGQLAQYSRGKFLGDLSAGLTVGVMLVPQGMAYALIAGLPPIYGLYAALVPLVIYAILGTSRQLAVGPVAMVSLLVASGVGPLAGGDTALYIQLTLLLSIMIGVMLCLLGFLRAGFLTNFLSHPVLAGFTSAAALIIGFNQLKHLLGIDVGRSNHIHEIVWASILQVGSVNGAALTIGGIGIVMLIVLKKWRRAFPGALVTVVLATASVWMFGFDVRIVGEVPGGLPGWSFPVLDVEHVRALLPTALTISLVGFMESIAVAKVYASKHRYAIDANQELLALGAANLVGGLFMAYPTTGGFSRTAVNDQAGARTNMAAVFSAIAIALALLFLTDLMYYLPNAVLASIVIVAVLGLIDWKEARYLWHVSKRDFGLMAVTFLATLGLGIEEGILAGVVISLAIVIRQSSQPHTAIEGKIPGTNTFRNVLRNPTATVYPGIVVFRMDASLYFANAAFFKEKIEDIATRSPRPRAIVLNAFPINRIDASALHTFTEIVQDLKEKKIDLYVAGIKGPVRDVLEKADLVTAIGANRFFLEVHEAVDAAPCMARHSNGIEAYRSVTREV